MPQRPALERVVLDSSVLLGVARRELVAAAALRYYTAYWSPWLVAEFVRQRTEWIAERAAREGCSRAETRRRLRASRERLNALIHELSHILYSVDYTNAPQADLSWLRDPDDWPVMQTALAAQAHTLVTENAADFPLGEERNGIRILSAQTFLAALYERFPDAAGAVREYLQSPTQPPDQPSAK